MSQTHNHCEYHLPVVERADGELLSVVPLLAEASGLSNQVVKQAMQKGAVWLTRGKHTRRLRRASRALKVGDELHFYYNPDVLAEQVTPAELVADEGEYSVWNKPYGMRSQGSKWGDHCTLYRWAEQHLEPQRSAFIVHRLDRAASGLILLAHSKWAAAKLSALFQQRGVTKHYSVWVHGDFSHHAAKPLTVDEPLDGKASRSHFRCVEFSAEKNRSRLDVKIDTGRKHQIRRHLAGQGFSVVGDRLYGREGDTEDLQLMACQLAFVCPLSGEDKSFELAPL